MGFMSKKAPLPSGRKTKMGMQNKRYRRTEEAILEVLFKAKGLPSTSKLVKGARISRSTLYRHHKTVPGIIPDYERSVLISYTRVIHKFTHAKNIPLKAIYLRTLIFIMAHRWTFEIILKYDSGIVFEKMVLRLKSKVIAACHLPRNSDRAIYIYAKEVAGILEEWGKTKFSEANLNQVLRDIIYLTKTIRLRLSQIMY